ncbi:ketoacyl-ACP synthase III [bacterium]|nr:ketoacyl-ACP synthase III [bacterium]
MPFGILGMGSACPENVLTNQDLEKMVDTSDEWIRTRSGIAERRIADHNTATSDIASQAGRKAIEDAGLTPADIDLIIVCTLTPDYQLPATACQVMENLEIPNCMAFDLNAACTGWLYGMICAKGLWVTGGCRHALVIGADCLTKITNFKDRATCVLFGDGAGAAVLGEVEEGRGILSHHVSCDGRMFRHIMVPGGGSRKPFSREVLEADEQFIQMDGNDVFKFAVRIMPETLRLVLDKAGLAVSDLDWVIPHQANLRIIENGIKRLDIPAERVIINLERFGNTSAASVGIALDEAYRAGRVKRGHTLGLVAFGGGLTWGGMIVRL